MNVLDDVADEADFKDKRRQIVVQEKCSLHEEIWHEVHQVTEKECESNVLKFPPFLVV